MVTKTDRSIARALDWARIHAGEHADTIIEALAAYDPECGGRTAQRGGGASEAADAQLADTQRAIIEAAEARGYARAKTEGEADARDAARWREIRDQDGFTAGEHCDNVTRNIEKHLRTERAGWHGCRIYRRPVRIGSCCRRHRTSSTRAMDARHIWRAA